MLPLYQHKNIGDKCALYFVFICEIKNFKWKLKFSLVNVTVEGKFETA